MPDINGQPIPGERLIAALANGQVDGNRLGQILFQLGPAMPFEAGFPFPRFVARAPAGPAAAAPLVQPAVIPSAQLVQVVPAAAPAQVTQPAAPAAQVSRPVTIGGMEFKTPVVSSIRGASQLRGI